VVCVFSAASVAFWVYGAINSAGLWQMRLLLPGLIPLLMPMALAAEEIKALNTRQLRISFIFSALVGLFIFTTLLDFSLLILVRNPLLPALGIQTRQQYLSKILPDYAVVLEWMEQTPAQARIYFVCEQRFYGIKREVQPDVNNDNLAHDFYLYGDAEGVLSAWQEKGYTHVLVSRRQLDILKNSNPTMTPEAWRETSRLEKMLPVMAVSPGGEFVLYTVPQK
jgi:hypothetical protein